MFSHIVIDILNIAILYLYDVQVIVYFMCMCICTKRAFYVVMICSYGNAIPVILIKVLFIV